MYEHVKKAFEFDLTDILVKNIEWKHVKWSTNRYLPRLVASISISELTERVPEIIEVLSYIREKYKIVDSVWMNYYRDGSDYTPYHRDSYNCTVLCVSFGAPRIFKIKDSMGKEQPFTLENGDIFVFDKPFNDTHQHCIAKTAKRVGPRISLVFFCDPE